MADLIEELRDGADIVEEEAGRPDNLRRPATLTAIAKDMRQAADRLAAAERVCVLFGWGPARGETEIEKAAGQAWSEWADVVPEGFTGPAQHPELGDEAIAALAAKRDRIREETLARLPVEVVDD